MNIKDIKVVAFHLPQFHVIPENEEWWGKGFTEWTNTKKAKPLFTNHYQPKTPLNDNYYNLLEKDALSWEMELAKKYQLDGFCYYHYWFNGKLLLEKPLEIMRNLSNRVPYFLCWANEPWIRSWEGSKEVLLDQKYGDEADWKAHFEYFSKFFTDAKYMKINNKPILVIYRAVYIKKCDEMISYWDSKCKEMGFEGIYIIEEKNGLQKNVMCAKSNAYLEFEPMYTISFGRNFFEKSLDCLISYVFNVIKHSNNLLYSYDGIWSNILRRKHERLKGKKTYLGAFVNWDNTARKGSYSTIFYGGNPNKFGKYLKKQLKKAVELDSELVFINAWNEWGEGTYLEPDNKHKYEYLKALSKAMEKE